MSSTNSTARKTSALPPFARGIDGGEMGKRIEAFDWSKNPLGPVEEWPQSLRTAVNILLSSRYAMWMAWGPELTFICNDAYRPTLGIKQPWALGARSDEVWAEIWPEIGPLIESVLTTGKATYYEGLLLFLERSGFPEETYHTFSYSPLADDSGRINGMLCVVAEETERLIGERRTKTLHDVASALSASNTEEEVLEAFSEQVGRNQKSLPFTLTYLFDEQGAARLACSSGISEPHPLAPPLIPPGSTLPWPAHEMFVRPVSRFIEDLSEQRRIAQLPAGDWNKPVAQAVIAPLKQQGQERPAGFLVAGINPYRRYDAGYSGFIDLLAGQLSAGLGNARAYEAERRRAEALAEIDRAKTTFFSNVSHELRTPLTLILSPVEELLAESTGTTPNERELLTLVHRNGLRLQRLVNTLLDFSRIEAGRIQAVYEATELGSFTEDLSSNFRSAMQRASLDFRIACERFDQPVYVDREMWEKIVLNLISNALKFTLNGAVTVTLKNAAQHAELTVQDTGTGIPKEDLSRIFERFHRVEGAKGRTIEGTGIGLALVQELVKLHGGTISVSSELGEGTTFTVRVPRGVDHLPKDKIRASAEQTSTALRADTFVEEALRWLEPPEDQRDLAPVNADTIVAARAGLEKVLIADDNADMRDYVSRLMAGRYAVVGVANGAEALKMAVSDPPDIILSDIMMPELNGFELVKALRENPATRTIPVILLSARAGEESRLEGLSSGADDYLVKPFTARELLARVSAHLSMRSRREEAEAALKESQATLQSFYDSSPLLMGVVELEGEEIVTLFGNVATARFLGTAVENIRGDVSVQIGVARHIDRIWFEAFRGSQQEGCPIHFEYEHAKSWETCWLSATVNYLGEGPSGRPRFSFVAEDITDRKSAEERLRRSNQELRRANADLEQFAYSASHDLQEPLRQVAVYSQLLEKKFAGSLEGKGLVYLNYLVEGAHRMELLISDLLAYSQATKGSDSDSRLVDTNQVLAEVQKNLATIIDESGAVISYSGLPMVQGDAVPLTHLFQNLLSNAIKYRSGQPPRIRVTAKDEGDSWLFAVQDNGIGIAKDFQSQIFGIFRRLHDKKEYPGTGIGLAICQKVVERYGGHIWVESEQGQGSTFFFTLPHAATKT